MRQVIDTTSLLVTIMLHFFCDEKRICSTIKKSENIFIMNMIAKFILLFMSLLTALLVKNILAGIYFIFLKKCPNQIWISVKRLEK